MDLEEGGGLLQAGRKEKAITYTQDHTQGEDNAESKAHKNHMNP